MSTSIKKKFNIIISGGGTGGHIFPAIAIADAIVNKFLDVKILFVGANGRMEMIKVPQAGYEIKGLNIAGLQRKLTFKNLFLPFKIISSLLHARKIIKTFKPHLAIGVGGYASGPMLFCASLSSVPTLIQEQNSFAGLTNKILAKFVDKICVAYSGMETFFPKNKLTITGNPVRDAILKDKYSKNTNLKQAFIDMGLKPNKFTVFAFGGSLGANFINKTIIDSMPFCQENSVQIILQTGMANYDNILKSVESLKKGTMQVDICVLPFIDNMNLIYKMADLVICRSGALSIAELCIVGKPVVFIPSPHLAEDHQTYNALALVKEDAALMVRESDNINQLHQHILKVKEDEKLKNKLSENIKKLAKPNATNDIIEEAERLLYKSI